MYLYIVRHGHPVYSPIEMLTETGHRQARALAPRMVQSGITKIYASPLRRARETAEPTANALGLPIGIEPFASESLTWSRFAYKKPDGGHNWIWYIDDSASLVRGSNRDAGDKWYDIEPIRTRLPNAKESYEALMSESDEFLARHGYVREGNEYRIENPSDERIAMFCHQGFGLSWLSHLLRIPPNIFWAEFDITHTGVTVLHFQNYKSGYTIPKVLTFSDMSHIFASDETDFKYHTAFRI